MPAQSLHLPLSYVHAIDQDGAPLHIVEAVQQFADRSFSCASSADKCDLLARLYRERDIMQDPVLTFVREPHMVERDATMYLRGSMRFGWRRNSYRRVEQLKDTLDRGHGRLHGGVLGAELTQGHEEFLQILDKGDERTERHRSFTDLPRSVPQHQSDGQRTGRLDYREECRLIDIGEVVGIAVITVTL